MKSTWKYLFQPHILSRGEDIYYSDDIDSIRKTKDGYEAIAHGTYDYEVEIDLKAGNVSGMFCTCPYASDGNNCKHMAALLYAVEEGDIDEPECSDECESIEEVLDSMNEDQLRKELLEIAKEERTYHDRLVNRYRTTPVGISDVKRVCRILEGLADQVGDRYGFIDWRNGHKYVRAFCDCLDENLSPMLERKEYMPAFEILKTAFEVLNHVEMDGSDGEHTDIACDIEEYWRRIIQMASKEDRDTMHKWFMDMKDVSEDWICGDSIETILEEAFDDPEYLLPLLENVRNSLESETNSYSLKNLLAKYRDLLRRCNLDESEYEKWMNEHSDEEAVREVRLDESREKGDTETEISLLKSLYENDEIEWRKKQRLEELLKAYEKINDSDHVKETLKLLLCEYTGSMEKVRKLRELSEPDEWEVLREKILKKNPDLNLVIFHEEKLYDRLLKALESKPIKTVELYRKELQEIYPDEILKIYVDYLYQLEKNHPCRSLYDEMKEYLFKTAEIEGGKQEVRIIADEWMRRYPTRRAMQEMICQIRMHI